MPRCVGLFLVSAAYVSTGRAQVGVTPGNADLGNRLTFSAGDTYTYDDNLFRLPSGTDITGGGIVSRQDHINTLNLGMDGHWFGWRQEFDIALRGAKNQFVRNDALDNTSGSGKLTWDWLINSRLSGTAGYDFNRTLASFANTFFFAKDLVDTADYFATGGLQLTQHWTLTTGFKATQVSHSADQRTGDEFRSRGANLGLQYLTNAQDSFELSYGYTRAHFPQPGVLNDVQFDRSYKDSVERLTVRYRLGGATLLDAKVGYIERKYPSTLFGNFSGSTWRASLTWVPTGMTQLVLSGYRELTAYLDAESDYFVSRGGSATLTWSPTVRIAVSASAMLNSQQYISNSPSTVEFNSRHDNVRTYQATASYVPRDLLSLTIGYRYDLRDSNLPLFSYIDRTAFAQILLKLRGI